jgi:hypothetical protein
MAFGSDRRKMPCLKVSFESDAPIGACHSAFMCASCGVCEGPARVDVRRWSPRARVTCFRDAPHHLAAFIRITFHDLALRSRYLHLALLAHSSLWAKHVCEAGLLHKQFIGHCWQAPPLQLHSVQSTSPLSRALRICSSLHQVTRRFHICIASVSVSLHQPA